MLGSTRRRLFVCALFAAGCGQGKPAAKPRLPPPVPVAAAEGAMDPASPPDRTPLAQRLLKEASEHPEALAEVDRRLETFAAAGLSLTRTRQVLASPLRADYCKTALSAGGLAFALCAFPSEAGARDGLRRSRASFDALIPGRSLVVNGSTLLTVTRPATAAAERELQVVHERFSHADSVERAAL